MKLSDKQIKAIRDALNQVAYFVSSGQNSAAVSALETLAEGIEEADVKARMAAKLKAPEEDSGAWQEAK